MNGYDPDHNPTLQQTNAEATMSTIIRTLTRLLVAGLIATTALQIIGMLAQVGGSHAFLAAGFDVRSNVMAADILHALVDGVKVVGGTLVAYVMDKILFKQKPAQSETQAQTQRSNDRLAA